MTTLATTSPLAAPEWSPFAIVYGLLLGYTLGALTVALWWLHRERKRAAGFGAFRVDAPLSGDPHAAYVPIEEVRHG